MPIPKALLSRLASFNHEEGLLRSGDRVLVAVSGGADSVCLAHYLTRLVGQKKIAASIVHFHHGLRAEADRDAKFVQKLCDTLNLPFLKESLPVRGTAKKERRSLEDAGRKLRYQALNRIARKLRFNKIATGHHQDDQVETVLLHLLRGKSAKGLGGITPSRPISKGSRIKLVRPLLALTREEIESYCAAYGLKFRTDASNKSEEFTRNWVRRKIVPLLAKRQPGVRGNIAAISKDIRSRFR